MNLDWSNWTAMPSPERCKQIEGPECSGVYQVRNKRTEEFILFGESVTCRKRMRSLFPKPYGTGTRNNENKRNYVLANWQDLEYRTVETQTKADAVIIDRYLKSLVNHKFNT